MISQSNIIYKVVVVDLNENIVIKKTGVDEISKISEFLVNCWKSTYKNTINDEYLSSMEKDYWVVFLNEKFREKKIECLTAENKNEMIGVCTFGNSITEKYPNDGEIISLYILEEYNGKGIGHQLFCLAQEELRSQGFQYGIVSTFCGNLKAIQFYENHGFIAMLGDESIAMGQQVIKYTVLRKELEE